MSKVVQLPAIANEGRFANKLIHYLVGKCYAESIGATVEIPKGWLGETLFDINEPYIQNVSDLETKISLPPFFNLPHRMVDPCLTRSTVKRLFKWRPGFIRVRCREVATIHVRRGDFLTEKDFPVIPEKELVAVSGVNLARVISEDRPSNSGIFPREWSFLEDFQTLMLSENVFVYPRSTFSQMAALLGDGNIYMPYDYQAGRTTCKFRLVDPNEPVIFPTKNNSLS